MTPDPTPAPLPAAGPARKAVCVFTGSSFGARACYRETAAALGRSLARRGLTLVYGGARVGLMGTVADAALAAGGRVVGVMPRHLVDREVAHRGLSELIITEDMSSRKVRMGRLADAFLALPGGYGTLDELFEVVTDSQLGLHRKPVGLLDSGGFWHGLQAFLAHTRAEGFLHDPELAVLPCEADPELLLDRLGLTGGASAAR